MKEVGNWHKPLKSINADVICLQETKITSKFIQSLIAILSNQVGVRQIMSDYYLKSFKYLGDQLEENTALEEGFNSYFAFSRRRSGYSGKFYSSKNPDKLKKQLSYIKNVRLIFMSDEYFKVLQHFVGIHLRHAKQKRG